MSSGAAMAATKVDEEESGLEYIDIPTFLRKQAD
jgi:hypothetical protein